MTPEQRACEFVKAHPEIRDGKDYLHIKVLDALAVLVEETERRAAREAAEQTRARCAHAAESRLIYTGPGGIDPEPYQKAIARAIRALPVTEEGTR